MIRLALISDIHGNLVSFEAVLADINRQKINEIIFLGDAATLGPQPHEVITRLKQLGCPCIIGNHETYLFKPNLGHAYMRGTQWFTDTLTWCRAQLTPEDYKFLGTFKPLLKFNLGPNSKLLCFHGSPRSNVENIFATTPAKELQEMLAGHQATIMAGGHTHIQMLRQHKGMMLINAGSVGMPFEEMPFSGSGPTVMPWAEYAILTYDNGSIGVELRRVAVDMTAVKQAALDSRMPEPTDWMSNWITLNTMNSE